MAQVRVTIKDGDMYSSEFLVNIHNETSLSVISDMVKESIADQFTWEWEIIPEE